MDEFDAQWWMTHHPQQWHHRLVTDDMARTQMLRSRQPISTDTSRVARLYGRMMMTWQIAARVGMRLGPFRDGAMTMVHDCAIESSRPPLMLTGLGANPEGLAQMFPVNPMVKLVARAGLDGFGLGPDLPDVAAMIAGGALTAETLSMVTGWSQAQCAWSIQTMASLR